MSDLNWPEDAPIITDAEFKVLRGAYREFEEHPTRPGWRFTGHYDADGDPLWHNFDLGDRHPNNPRAEFIGLFDDKGRPLYYVRPRFFGFLQEPITLDRGTWQRRTGWKRAVLRVLVPAARLPLATGEYRTKGSFIYCAAFIIAPFWFFAIGATVAGVIAGLRALAGALAGLH